MQQLKTPAKSKPPVVTTLKQSATPKLLPETSATSQRRLPQTKVIRRVQATYEVKAESDEEDQLSAEDPPPNPTYRRSRLVESDSGGEYDDDEEFDEDEDELMIGPDVRRFRSLAYLF